MKKTENKKIPIEVITKFRKVRATWTETITQDVIADFKVKHDFDKDNTEDVFELYEQIQFGDYSEIKTDFVEVDMNSTDIKEVRYLD